MKSLLYSRTTWITGAIILIGIALFGLLRTFDNGEPERITTTVTYGDVLSIISVSGVVDSENAADLSFPLSDIVATVLVDEGDHVNEGDVLVTLTQNSLVADRNDALASLVIVEADLDELIEGPTNEARNVTESSVAIATEDLARITAEQNERVENARRTLFSSNLEAVSTDADENATPPTISGTYTCEEETEYTLDVYSSNSDSGYSYQLQNGGVKTAHTESARPLGNCGLLIRFDQTALYNGSEWKVEVPNKRSATYATNLNTYELALVARDNAIEAAEQALELAQNEQTLENADPREEALARAEAKVLQAEARIAAIDAEINDRILRAPFDGTITDVSVLVGEVSGTAPVVTLVSDNTYELTIRIPEIDITHISVGDSADVTFDARTDEIIDSSIDFISPLGTEIDGVAYYEGHLAFDTPPVWLRSGLNADVDIIVDGITNVARLPSRFVETVDGKDYVYSVIGDEIRRIPVDVGFRGNNGFIEVQNLTEDMIIAAPPEGE